MFLIFDLDSIWDGLTSTTSIFLKLFISLGIIAIPVTFLQQGEGVALRCIVLAIIIAMFLMNILVIIRAISKIFDKKSDNKNDSSKINNAKFKRNAIIVLIMIIMFSLIGYCFPLYLNLVNLKLSKIPSAIVLPFFFMGIYITLLSNEYNTDKKHSVFNYLSKFLVNFVLVIFQRILLITAIIFFIISLLYNMGQDRDFKNTGLKEGFASFSDILYTQIEYYDEKYASNRSENFDIKQTVENELYNVKEILYKDSGEREKLANIYRTNVESYENQKSFFTQYIRSKLFKADFQEKYGISISLTVPSYTEYEDTRFFVKVYDLMYEKAYYYEFDYENCKIIDTFKNKQEADNKYNLYVREYKENKK